MAISASSDAKRILVVDDNKDAATSLAELLELEGHEVKAVYTAEAALREVHTFHPDMVLLDLDSLRQVISGESQPNAAKN